MAEFVHMDQALRSSQTCVTFEVHWDIAEPGWCDTWIETWEHEDEKEIEHKRIKEGERMTIESAYKLAMRTAEKIKAPIIGLREVKPQISIPNSR